MRKPGQKVKFRDVLGKERIGTIESVNITYTMEECLGDPHSVFSKVYEDQILEELEPV